MYSRSCCFVSGALGGALFGIASDKRYKHIVSRRIPDLKDLWNWILTAYHCNSLEELKELKELVVLALSMTDRLKDGDIPISIPDIEEKIKHLEREISEIILTQPYTY